MGTRRCYTLGSVLLDVTSEEAYMSDASVARIMNMNSILAMVTPCDLGCNESENVVRTEFVQVFDRR